MEIKKIKIQTRKKLPEVYYSDEVLKSSVTNSEANQICAHAMGSIAMKSLSGTTGFKGRFVFATYNVKENTLIVTTLDEFKN